MALTIGMVAHDRKKPDLAAWAQAHLALIARHKVVATATTGSVLQRAAPDLPIKLVKSGPLGGDQQIGAMIAQGELDVLLFFPDPLEAQPHDVDVKALLRLVLVYRGIQPPDRDRAGAVGPVRSLGSASTRAPLASCLPGRRISSAGGRNSRDDGGNPAVDRSHSPSAGHSRGGARSRGSCSRSAGRCCSG